MIFGKAYRAPFIAPLVLLAYRTPAAAASDRQINGSASAGNYIHAEQEIDLSSTEYRSTIEITSDVPVTIQRYSDGGSGNTFTFGQQPLPDDMAKVLVTSNCDTSDTLVVPTIDVFENGDISVVLDGANVEDTDFLSPSSYSAFWTWVSDFCGFNLNPFDPQFTLPTRPVVESKPALMADGCPEDQCRDPNGKCADKVFCFASPCSTETCDSCVDNFCGGCNAMCKPPLTCSAIAGQCLDPEGRCVTEASCDKDPCLMTGACRELESCTSSTCTGCRPLCAAAPEDQQLLTDPEPPVEVLPDLGTPSECECQVGAGASSSCGVGEFCQLGIGVCDPMGEIASNSLCGKCAEIPFFCTEEYDPVCACDGVTTYSNACDAWSASASVSYKGKCRATKPTISTDPDLVDGQRAVCQVGPNADSSMALACEAGEFCQLDIGVCNDESGVHEGTCAQTPFLCTLEYDPVCACDGKTTYSNACQARSEAASVSRMGECDAKPDAKPSIATSQCQVGPSADPSMACGAGEFCQLDTGVCNNKSGVHEGTCVETIPESVVFCSKEYDPVCACDGRSTYWNVCEAHAAGVSVSRMGECQAAPPTRPTISVLEGVDDPAIKSPSCPESLGGFLRPNDSSELYYAVVPSNPPGANNGLLCARLEVKREGWIGFGISPNGRMIGSDAIIGLPNDGSVLKYDLLQKSTRSVVSMGSESQTLIDTSIEQVDGMTIMEFTKLLVEDGENAILEEGLNNFLCAVGSSNTLGYHAIRSPFTKDFSDDIVKSTTIATVEAGNGLMCNLCEGITTGYVQIPNTNCGEFSQCVNGNMSEKITCSDDLIFDKTSNTCNWKSITRCGPDPECPTDETTSTVVDTTVSATSDPTDSPISSQPQSSSPTESPSKRATATPSEEPTISSTSIPTVSPSKEATKMPSKSPIGVSTSPTGSPNKKATEMPSNSPIRASSSNPTGTPSKEATITDATTVPNTTVDEEGAATSAATAVASNTGITTSSATTTMMPDGVATSAAASAATTEASITTTKATSFAIDGNFPTSEPTKPSNTEVPTKSPNDLEDDGDSDGIPRSNSALNQSRSFSFCVATAFMAIVAVSLIFPGFGGNSNLWGYGKFAVATVAVSSLYPKSSRVFKKGNVRRTTKRVPTSFTAQNERALQKMCTFNVEVLISGCTHPLQISAPAGRIVDVTIDDLELKEHEDPCVSDYEATLNFPVTRETIVLDLNASGTVETFPEFGSQCTRPVAGRPFVDAKGGSLHAMPWVPDDEDNSMVSALSWTGEDSVKTQISRVNNATNHGRVLLGEEWIQRALGEHASIASFSAFSIALMSNGAPAALINDALKAGLDEVRHARTSFDIASKLTAREIGPGPLPESKLEFGQDLKILALAVAREGCLDETLSAFAAAVEVAHINEVLDNEVQDSPYSNIDRDLLGSIKNELVTIAIDESNHSALAWRTLSWVCSVDLNVCDEVNMDVFEESNLTMRFNQHADSSFGETSRVLHSMKEEWNKILTAHQLGKSGLKGESTCEDEDTVNIGEDDAGKALLTTVTENIIRQVLGN